MCVRGEACARARKCGGAPRMRSVSARNGAYVWCMVSSGREVETSAAWMEGAIADAGEVMRGLGLAGVGSGGGRMTKGGGYRIAMRDLWR